MRTSNRPNLTEEFAMNLKGLLCLFPLLLGPGDRPLRAQSDPGSALFKTVEALDTKLFDAYNHCDLATLGAMVADDLEFYHDKTGLAVGKDLFITAIKQNICGKVERTLVRGSLEVHPLQGYG